MLTMGQASWLVFLPIARPHTGAKLLVTTSSPQSVREIAALQIGPLRLVATLYRRTKEGAIASIEDHGRIYFLGAQVRAHFSAIVATTRSWGLKIAHRSEKLDIAAAFESAERAA